MINLILTNEWFAVAGGTLEVIGLGVVAAVVLYTPNAVWARRG